MATSRSFLSNHRWNLLRFLSSPPLQAFHHRSISSTCRLDSGWIDKIKGVFTGQKSPPSEPQLPPSKSFTLLKYADELRNARVSRSFKKFIVGRSSEATFAEAFEKQEAIIRYLGGFDPTGENLRSSQKQSAAKHCNCTIADVENALAKFSWAKEAQKKMEKLKEEGKPMPKSMAEVQKLMGSSPLDLARSNLAKSGQISRNAPCPCGSKKKYKCTLTAGHEKGGMMLPWQPSILDAAPFDESDPSSEQQKRGLSAFEYPFLLFLYFRYTMEYQIQSWDDF